jgi:hypothetical protein
VAKNPVVPIHVFTAHSEDSSYDTNIITPLLSILSA